MRFEDFDKRVKEARTIIAVIAFVWLGFWAGVIGFVVWVVIKLLSHFGVI